MNDPLYIGIKASSRLSETSILSEPLRIRASSHNYLAAIFLGTFFSAFFFYLEFDLAAMAIFIIAWVVLPFLALNDKISFDGRRLTRSGLLPRGWAWLNRSRRHLRINDIEQVETQVIRTLRRGGKAFYRYRTIISGKGLQITLLSGGAIFRSMIKAILPMLPCNALDIRSIDLRDHLTDPKETLMRAEFERIPSDEAICRLIKDQHANGKTRASRSKQIIPQDGLEKAEDLSSLANELQIAGYPLRAIEVFRQALLFRPRSAKLLFEFGRCLHSVAHLEKDRRLELRSLALLRMAERYAGDDSELLARLGECYTQLGEWRSAARVFRIAKKGDCESYRILRGLAEMALREGKIAYVIQHYFAANQFAESTALRRWSKREAEYFSNLSSDEEYLEMELSRVNMLETIERSQKTALRISYLAFPIVVFGLAADDGLIANIGWAVAAISLLIWIGMHLTAKILSRRIPFEMMREE